MVYPHNMEELAGCHFPNMCYFFTQFLMLKSQLWCWNSEVFLVQTALNHNFELVKSLNILEKSSFCLVKSPNIPFNPASPRSPVLPGGRRRGHRAAAAAGLPVLRSTGAGERGAAAAAAAQQGHNGEGQQVPWLGCLAYLGMYGICTTVIIHTYIYI